MMTWNGRSITAGWSTRCHRSCRQENLRCRTAAAGTAQDKIKKKAAAITVIGGTSGPTSVFIAGGCKRSAHTAFSSLHFKAANTVEWRMVFHVKMAEDIVVKLL